MKKITSLLIIASVALSGCATIMGEKEQTVKISSTPDKAEFTITDEKNTEIESGNTPKTVTLDKGDGSYFGGKTYNVEFKMAGYESKTVTIHSKANGWYIGGNIIFGGLIGWLIVDPFTGAMYNLTPDEVDADLEKTTSQSDIHVVLLKDVPKALHSKMKKLN
tara:strand:+ start:31 stop:519 length:489 start_codon:yes stop_codon:yes gene_type:complete